jgi:hypothetical protein
MNDLEIVVGRRRGKTWRRVGHGLRCRGREAESDAAELVAWQELLPSYCWFTHLTAASAHGLWLPPLPAELPVFVGLPRSRTRPKRPELKAMRASDDVRPVAVSGLRLAPVPETLLACARHLGVLDLVMLLDSARRRPDVRDADIEAVTQGRRWGARRLERAMELSDPRAESPWESVLRVFHEICEVPVVPQHEVRDAHGAFVARGDLWLEGTRTLHEYDGAVHRERRAHVTDLARDRRIVNAGFKRRGYTAQDLLARASVVLREADADLGRPHDRRRLKPWHALLDGSLLTPRGRARVARTWQS